MYITGMLVTNVIRQAGDDSDNSVVTRILKVIQEEPTLSQKKRRHHWRKV